MVSLVLLIMPDTDIRNGPSHTYTFYEVHLP